MSDPVVMKRLASILDDACMDIAELMADAEDSRAVLLERALELRAKIGTVSRMAGLGDLPEMHIERKVVRAESEKQGARKAVRSA